MFDIGPQPNGRLCGAELPFDLLPTSTIIRQGYSLRLVVTGADPRQRSFMRQDPELTGGDEAFYVDIPVVPLEPIVTRQMAAQ